MKSMDRPSVKEMDRGGVYEMDTHCGLLCLCITPTKCKKNGNATEKIKISNFYTGTTICNDI